MARSVSISWVVALVLFCGFGAGAWFAHQAISGSAAQRDLDRCLRQATASGASWQMRSRVTLCNDLYAASPGGRYGARSSGTISLASVRRPIFDIRY